MPRFLLAAAVLAAVCAAAAAGCCCCTGACLYAGDPPCPCPAPPPNGHQPLCGVQKMLNTFAGNYKGVVARLGTMPGGTDAYPSKTQPPSAALAPASGGFTWATNSGWTSGFFPGLLWQIANNTGDAAMHQAAATWTAGREVEKTETTGHDIGFMIFGSFGNGIQLGSSNTTGYAAVVVEAAHSLAKRYNAKVGMTRSWGHIDDPEAFEVIIDNLMNLELLFWASAHSGNTTLADMAKSHATRTGELWIRADGSTAHLCTFDPKTGKLKSPCTGTPQGFAAGSTWARGQGWGVYGFTLAHRYTQDKKYLAYAIACANYYIKNAGQNQVPLWDFNVPAAQAFNDTSSAAITASGLLELAQATGDKQWRDEAVKIIDSLINVPGFAAPPNTSEAVLIANAHDTGGLSMGTVIETDYYMYEALRRLAGHFPPAAAV